MPRAPAKAAPPASVTPAQKKNLLRLMESRDAAAREQARALLRSLADPSLYDAVLASAAVKGAREGVRYVDRIDDKSYVAHERRPWRAETWGPGWHWPAANKHLALDDRDFDDDGFAMVAEAPATTPARVRLAEDLTSLNLVLQGRYKAPEYFEPGFLDPYTNLRALSVAAHRAWRLTGERLQQLVAGRGLRTLSLVDLEMPDGLAALEAAPELEVLEICSSKLATLASLPALPKLRSLLLRNTSALTTLGAPGRFPALRHFVALSAGSLRDLGALEGCSSLESVRILHAPKVTDLGPLRSSRGLETLTLFSAMGARSFEAISEARALAHLDVVQAPALETLAHVSTEKLQVLCVERAPALKTLGPARPMPALRTAALYKCDALEDIDALAGAVELAHVDVVGARALRSVAPLAGLAKVTRLDLRSTTVSSPEPINKLGALRVAALCDTGLAPEQLSPRARAVSSFHPWAQIDPFDTRTEAQIAKLIELA